MSAEDRYDATSGRVLDGPDDPDQEACVQHGNPVDTCAECRAEWMRVESEYRAELAAVKRYQQSPAFVDDISDLPY